MHEKSLKKYYFHIYVNAVLERKEIKRIYFAKFQSFLRITRIEKQKNSKLKTFIFKRNFTITRNIWNIFK